MSAFKNILVGVDLSHGDHLITSDLSPETRGAIAQATEVALQQGARLTFCAVVDLDPHTLSYLELEDQDGLKNLGNQAESVLQSLVETAKSAGVSDVASTHAFGKSWVELTRQVMRSNYDMVMAGTRGLHGIEGLLLGSTGLKLLRNCPCPVWITKPHITAPVTRILVADDLSAIGARLVRIGAAIAGARKAELHVLHAFDYPWDSKAAAPDTKQEAYRQKTRAHADAEIAKHLNCTEVASLAVAPKIIYVEEKAENAILRYAREQQIDLLVMATIARSGLAGFLMGNTAERLLPQLGCSVLALKPDDFRCPVSLEDPH